MKKHKKNNEGQKRHNGIQVGVMESDKGSYYQQWPVGSSDSKLDAGNLTQGSKNCEVIVTSIMSLYKPFVCYCNSNTAVLKAGNGCPSIHPSISSIAKHL